MTAHTQQAKTKWHRTHRERFMKIPWPFLEILSASQWQRVYRRRWRSAKAGYERGDESVGR